MRYGCVSAFDCCGCGCGGFGAAGEGAAGAGVEVGGEPVVLAQGGGADLQDRFGPLRVVPEHLLPFTRSFSSQTSDSIHAVVIGRPSRR